MKTESGRRTEGNGNMVFCADGMERRTGRLCDGAERITYTVARFNGEPVEMHLDLRKSRTGRTWKFNLSRSAEFDMFCRMFARVGRRPEFLALWDPAIDRVAEASRHGAAFMILPSHTALNLAGWLMPSRKSIVELVESACPPVWRAAAEMVISCAEPGDDWDAAADRAQSRFDWETGTLKDRQ